MAYDMNGIWKLRGLFFFFTLVFSMLASCRSDKVDKLEAPQANSQELAQATAVVFPTDTPTSTATSTPTVIPTVPPTATPTPSPTPTPTPTALPINISGDPRAAVLNNHEAEEGPGCGIVDLLDFPLDPPDALQVNYGGQGFGRFRSRYDQYHAGEDWQLHRGRSNLGVPVHAIGHGRVTYAQPLGWGRDQGVIIIRHTFADGSTVLSFYGHMDPDSVILRAGECVERGQKIAEIGQPRTPPHLHFEIRTHLPNETGPGYWPVDPTEAGWLPPSQFIWNYRISSMPGVDWAQPFNDEQIQLLNLVNDDTIIAVEESQLLGLSLADGGLRWRKSFTETIVSAAVDAGQSQLYTVNWSGEVAAYSILEDENGTTSLSDDPIWQLDSKMMGSPNVLPLPGEGLLVTVRDEAAAFSADGELLWREMLDQRLFDWLLLEDQLIMTSAGRQGPVYSATSSGLETWPIPVSGRPIKVGDQIWLYDHDGLYRLDPSSQSAELLYQLPPSFIRLGKITALPDGGAIIAHRDKDDSRLVAFNPDGSVQWQRSFNALGWGDLKLVLHNGQPYLLLQSSSGSAAELNLYEIDIQSSTLTHIFTGGTRSLVPGENWIRSVDENFLLINIGGGSLVALNPESAIELLNPTAN